MAEVVDLVGPRGYGCKIIGWWVSWRVGLGCLSCRAGKDDERVMYSRYRYTWSETLATRCVRAE